MRNVSDSNPSQLQVCGTKTSGFPGPHTTGSNLTTIFDLSPFGVFI